MPRQILLVVNEIPESSALHQVLEGPHGELGRASVLVVAPALNSRLKHWLSDEDDARREAEDRLARSLEHLAGVGVEADGWVGDADPLQAIDDALHLFPAERVVVATYPDSQSNWLARDLVPRARRRFPVPILATAA